MFNKLISVVGNKGGVGKTTSGHMLAYGLAMFGVAPIVITTDAGRRVRNDENRPYQIASGQTPEALENIFGSFRALDVDPESPKVLIIDGGAGRVGLDAMFVQHSDLSILPFRDSEEDLDVVRAELDQFPTAFGLPAQWPANAFTRAQVTAVLTQMQTAFPDRILNPVPAIRSSQNLLRDEMGPVDTKLRSVCRALAVDVMQRLDINLYQLNQ